MRENENEFYRNRPDGNRRMEIGDIFMTAREGKETAWAMLLDRLSSMIKSIAHSYRLNYDDIGEITQTAWLRLLENADYIREPHAVGSWLAVTTRRECIKATRSRARERSMEVEFIAEALGIGDDDTELPISRSERHDALAEALEKLPVHQRLLLRTLMAEPTPSYLAISQALKLPIGSIGPTRGRALARLRENGALRAALED
jgi:RNA polymerase sigma factor (sigma-70 family)